MANWKAQAKRLDCGYTSLGPEKGEPIIGCNDVPLKVHASDAPNDLVRLPTAHLKAATRDRVA